MVQVSEPCCTSIVWLLLFLYFIYLLRNKFQRHLHRIPGPFLASFTDLWRLHNSLTRRPHDVQLKLHQRHASKFIRIGPSTIAISDASLVPKIYGPNSGFAKGDFYSVFMFPFKGGFYPSIFNTTDEKYHGRIKRPIASSYSLPTTVKFEPLIDSTTSVFIDRLDEFATFGKPFDLSLWIAMYAFDVLGEICFSKRMGFLETSSDVNGIIADVQKMLKLGGGVGQVPFLDKLLMKNWLSARLMPVHPVVKFCVARMEERNRRLQECNVRGSGHVSETDDFLTRCRVAQEKFPDVVNDDMIRTYNVDNIIAGSDTLANSLSAVFYSLLRNPSCHTKLLAEIDTTPHNGFFSWQNTKSLPYLQACIKEAMRLYPVVGLLLERVVPSGGVELNGHYLPSGTIVGCNPWVVHRDKELYGSDAEDFRPERWLEANMEQLKAMERANLAFGSGSRICIGKHISMVEMSKLIPELLKRYEFRFVDEGNVEVEGGWFTRLKGFDVVVSKR